MYIALGCFVAAGGMEVLFTALMATFDRVPIGGFALSRVPLDSVVGVLASGMELGIRVATPVTCIVFLIMISMGFIMKTMPQINVMSVGFTLKILFGLGMCAAAIGTMHRAIAGEVDRVLRFVLDWGHSLT
jgi:flagellar biosynthetic protein FliR